MVIDGEKDIKLFKHILKEAHYSYLRERDTFLKKENVTPEMQAWADKHIYEPLKRVEQLLVQVF